MLGALDRYLKEHDYKYFIIRGREFLVVVLGLCSLALIIISLRDSYPHVNRFPSESFDQFSFLHVCSGLPLFDNHLEDLYDRD